MKKLRTRLLSLLLVMAMVVTLLPVYSMAVIAADPAEEVQEPQEEPKVEEPKVEEPQEEPKVEEPQEEPKVEETQEEPQEESKVEGLDEEDVKEKIKEKLEEGDKIDLSVGYFDDRFSSEWVSFDTYTQGQKKTFNGSTYRFGGWYTGIDGSGSRLRKEADAQIDGEYYAKWVSEDGVTVTTTPLDFTKAEVRAQYSRMKNGIRISGNDTRGYKVTLEGAVIDCRVAYKAKLIINPGENIGELHKEYKDKEAETSDASQTIVSDELLDELNLAGIMGEGEVSIQDYIEEQFDQWMTYIISCPEYITLLLPDNTELNIKRGASSTIITDVEYGIVCAGSLDICGDGKLSVFGDNEFADFSCQIAAYEISNSGNVKIGNISDIAELYSLYAWNFENYGKIEVVGPDVSSDNYGIEGVNSITNYGYLKVNTGQACDDMNVSVYAGKKLDNYGTIDVNIGTAMYSYGIYVGDYSSGFSSEQEITRENAVLYNKGRINVQSGDVPYVLSDPTYSGGTFGIYAEDSLIYNDGIINTTGGDLISVETFKKEVGITGITDFLYEFSSCSLGMYSGYLYNTGKVSAIAGDFDLDEDVFKESVEEEVVETEDIYESLISEGSVMLCGLYSEIVDNTGSIEAAGGNLPQITLKLDMTLWLTVGIFGSEVWNYGRLSSIGGTGSNTGITSVDSEIPIIATEDLEAETLDELASIMVRRVGSLSLGMFVLKDEIGRYSLNDSEEVITQSLITDDVIREINLPFGVVYNEGTMKLSGDYSGLATQVYIGMSGSMTASGNVSAMSEMFGESYYIFQDSALTASAKADGTDASGEGVSTKPFPFLDISGIEMLTGFEEPYTASPKYFSSKVREHKVTSASRIEGTNKEGGRVRGANKRATYAEGVKVTAEDKKGYDFVGWYIGYSSSSNGTEVPSEMIKSENYSYKDKTITYYPLEDTVLTAVYKPKAVTSVKLKIKAPGYTITGTDGKQQGSNSYKFTPGTSVTVKFTDDSFEFKCWRDQNGRKVSTNSEYTFTINKNTELTAEYSKKPQKKTNKWTPVRYR